MPFLTPRWALLLATLVSASSLAAQTAATPLQKAAETITKEDVARHVGVIADDSMMGRDTPSPGLEKTAQYVADQFKTFGLKPAGDSGSWLQRYPLGAMKADFSRSRVLFSAGGKEAAASFTTAVRLAAQGVPAAPEKAAVVIVSGQHTTQTLTPASVQGKTVLFVPPVGLDSVRRGQQLNAIFRSSKGIIVVSDLDSAAYAQRLTAALGRTNVSAAPSWAVHLRPESVKDLAGVLAAAGVDLAKARVDTTPTIRELPALTVALQMQTERTTAPNTVGLLEGSDPKLKDEYIVFSAHMDHVGIGRGADSIHNGADDDASGTTGVIELAEAFSRPGARPKRSMIFLTVSGEEKGLWGSAYFADHPPVTVDKIVANINLDMIGRNWTDTIVAIGKEHSDLGATLERVTKAHPELRMAAIDDIWPQERFYFRSDHYNFAKKGVPILFFFNGVHKDYHEVTDSPDKIDSEKEARLLRLVFYLGQDIGNAAQRPQWNPESYKQIVK